MTKKSIHFGRSFLPSLTGQHKYAFTLSEVLITFGIIGVVGLKTRIAHLHPETPTMAMIVQ